MPRGVVIKTEKVMPFAPEAMKKQYLSRMLLDEESFGSHTLQLNHAALKPGGVITPGSHRAPYDEVYYIIRGSGIVQLDGVDHDVESDTLIYIPAETLHGVVNTSEKEDLEWLTVWAGTPEEGVNGVYDERKREWGTNFKKVDSSA